MGLLDLVAIYLEKRHHELWISTDAVRATGGVHRANVRLGEVQEGDAGHPAAPPSATTRAV